MSLADTLQKIGLTPAKAVLIGVLGIVFVAIVLSNFMPASPPTSANPTAGKTARRTPLRRIPGDLSHSDPVDNQPVAASRLWPQAQLEVALDHDPFVLPEPLRPPNPEPAAETEPSSSSVEQEMAAKEEMEKRLELQRQVAQKLKTLHETGIGIALVTPEKRIINVDGKKLQVGDLWEGFRIVEIRHDGSVVVKIE
jgi:hypothetical protein